MQNEPQLSSEMERKLRLLLDETIEDMEGYIETDGKMLYSDALFCRLFDSQKHFLATALEEQRQGYEEKIKLLMDEDMAEKLADNMEKMFGVRECKICGTNPEKQRELVLAILNRKGE